MKIYLTFLVGSCLIFCVLPSLTSSSPLEKGEPTITWQISARDTTPVKRRILKRQTFVFDKHNAESKQEDVALASVRSDLQSSRDVTTSEGSGSMARVTETEQTTTASTRSNGGSSTTSTPSTVNPTTELVFNENTTTDITSTENVTSTESVVTVNKTTTSSVTTTTVNLTTTESMFTENMTTTTSLPSTVNSTTTVEPVVTGNSSTTKAPTSAPSTVNLTTTEPALTENVTTKFPYTTNTENSTTSAATTSSENSTTSAATTGAENTTTSAATTSTENTTTSPAATTSKENTTTSPATTTSAENTTTSPATTTSAENTTTSPAATTSAENTTTSPATTTSTENTTTSPVATTNTENTTTSPAATTSTENTTTSPATTTSTENTTTSPSTTTSTENTTTLPVTTTSKENTTTLPASTTSAENTTTSPATTTSTENTTTSPESITTGISNTPTTRKPNLKVIIGSTSAGVVIIICLTIVLILFLHRWYRKKTRRRLTIPDSESELDECTDWSDEDEVEMPEDEYTDAVKDYLKIHKEYTKFNNDSLRQHELGSRMQKRWYSKVWEANDSEMKKLLTVGPVSQSCPLKLHKHLKGLNKLLVAVKEHPYLHLIEHVEFIIDHQLLVMVQPFVHSGSLKDLIYQSSPMKSWSKKYAKRSRALSIDKLARYGRQILEAMKFLYSQGFPTLGHVQTGNIFVVNDVCQLGGYENTLLGYKTRLFRLCKDDLQHFDIVLFGHVIFEMAAGYELTQTRPGQADYMAVDTRVKPVLEYIFAEGFPHDITEISTHEFFGNVSLRELCDFDPSKVQLDNSMKKVLAKAHKNKPRVQKQPATEGNKEGSITSKIMSSLKNVVGGSGSKSDPPQDDEQQDHASTIKTKKKGAWISRTLSKKQKVSEGKSDSLQDKPKNDTIKTKKKRSGISRRFSKKQRKSGDEANLLNDIGSDDDDELY